MPLRRWGWGRLALTVVGYWAALFVASLLLALWRARTAAAAYRAAHPAQQDFVASGSALQGTWQPVAWLLGPPLVLLAYRVYARRDW